MQWVKSIKYLGVTILQAKEFKCNWDEAKRKLYCNANVIFGRLGTNTAPAVLLKLIYSQGVQNLLYGITATSLSAGDLKSMCYAYDSMFYKILNSYDKNVIFQCQYYSGYLSFNVLYELQRYMFLKKLFETSFIEIRSEIDCVDVREFSFLKTNYKFMENVSKVKLKMKAWKVFEHCLGSIKA